MRGAPEPLSSALPTGWAELDDLLGGGWPVGALCELCGRGRSSLSLGAVRQAQARELPVAWVDGGGVFCPVTARVDLTALTLVRPGADEEGGLSSGFSGGGAAARRMFRRGSAPGDGGGGSLIGRGRAGRGRAGHDRALSDRALLAADLLLRSRAFALVVLDLPTGSPPLSRWFRLARQAAAASAWLLLLGREGPSRAGSAADLVLASRLHPVSPRDWGEPPPPRMEVTRMRQRRSASGGGGGAGCSDSVLLGRPDVFVEGRPDDVVEGRPDGPPPAHG